MSHLYKSPVNRLIPGGDYTRIKHVQWLVAPSSGRAHQFLITIVSGTVVFIGGSWTIMEELVGLRQLLFRTRMHSGPAVPAVAGVPPHRRPLLCRWLIKLTPVISTNRSLAPPPTTSTTSSISTWISASTCTEIPTK